MPSVLHEFHSLKEEAPNYLSSLLRLRACSALLSHRLAGGAQREDTNLTVNRYLAALDAAPRVLQEKPFDEALRYLHSALLGQSPSSSTFRTKPVYCSSMRKGARKHRVAVHASDIVSSLADLDRVILKNKSLDPLTRIFLAHFELIYIHPFMDGNGRLARLILTVMLGEVTGSQMPVDLTRPMRGAFGPYNLLLRSKRNSSTYATWLRLYDGFAKAESQALIRIVRAASTLDDAERKDLCRIADRGLATVELAGSLETVLTQNIEPASPKVQHILKALVL